MSNSRRLTIGQNIDGGESGGGLINTSNYMTILALEDGLTASLSNNACQYCIDGDGNWINLPSGTTTQSINQGQTLSFKGNLTPNSSTGIGTFTITKQCNLEGNCMSMLFGDDAVNNNSLSGKKYAFYFLFNGCTTIIQVSETFLPATTLANSCYEKMFYGCSSLTTAPVLPATRLNFNCYYDMFRGCTSLTVAPELPATTLASNCYGSMFRGCTSLTTAPSILPATTLNTDCYDSMFRGCSSLTVAPELPATTLANYCYEYMFYGCRNLTTAPELPATALASYCYRYMFYGCSNLTYIMMLATDISAILCLDKWVSNVSSTGTFVKNPSMTSLPTGTSGIPSGWTVVDDTGGGGSSLITFTVDGTEYQAEEGMTFYDWGMSEYYDSSINLVVDIVNEDTFKESCLNYGNTSTHCYTKAGYSYTPEILLNSVIQPITYTSVRPW